MSNSTLLNTLIHLDNEYGVSGDETAVAAVLRQEMDGLYDEYKADPMGNQYFIKYGKNRDKKIVFSAHMDEIGFIINYIEPNGLARFLPVGYHDDRTAVNQDMVVITDDGSRVYGYAIAADTGYGMMDGSIAVDVFMGSYADSCHWGAVYVDIYVLSEGDNRYISKWER